MSYHSGPPAAHAAQSVLQCHVQDSQNNQSDLAQVTQAFYIDKQPDHAHAKAIGDRMRQLFAEGGFEIRQWASNLPLVIEHLPSEASCISNELWLSRYGADLDEPTLGLQWKFQVSSKRRFNIMY